MVSRLSMDLKAELNRLQFGVSDVLGWQRDGEQRVTMVNMHVEKRLYMDQTMD